MEITNVRIKNVTVGLDSRHNLSARMTFENQYATCDWSFSLTDPVDVHRLMKLMSYAGTNTVQKLNGKIVRKSITTTTSVDSEILSKTNSFRFLVKTLKKLLAFSSKSFLRKPNKVSFTPYKGTLFN